MKGQKGKRGLLIQKLISLICGEKDVVAGVDYSGVHSNEKINRYKFQIEERFEYINFLHPLTSV